MRGTSSFQVAIGILATGLVAAVSNAATLLLEYDSESGKIPNEFNIRTEANSLKGMLESGDPCPFRPGNHCWWQGLLNSEPNDGLRDNDGAPAHADSGADKVSRGGQLSTIFPIPGSLECGGVPPGCGNAGVQAPAPAFGGYMVNLAPNPTGQSGTSTYTERLEFDDDGGDLLHIDLSESSSLQTPKGAADFPGAPEHSVLRLVGGDGNGVAGSLSASAENNRNSGKVRLYREIDLAGTVTVFIRAASGLKQEGDAFHPFVGLWTWDDASDKVVRFRFFHWTPRTFSGGVPICDAGIPTVDCGKFGVINDTDQAGQTKAQEFVDDPGNDLGSVLPETFFSFRAICDPANGGKARIWVNEGTPSERYAEVDNDTFGEAFDWEYKDDATGTREGDVEYGLIRDKNDQTFWIDRFALRQGAVEPDPCDVDNVFDVRNENNDPISDGLLTDQDKNAFLSCVTGPAPDPDLFNTNDPAFIGAECVCMDVDGDLEIAQKDFAYFQLCAGLTAAANPAEFETCDDAP